MAESDGSPRLRHLEGLAELAGGLAHDFNNLLAAIRGTASVGRKRTETGDPAHGLFADIERLVDDASRVTSGLLLHARDDQYVIERVLVDEFVQQCTQDFARNRTGAVRLELEPGAKAVHVDRTKLQQVLLNLLHNASAATATLDEITVRTQTADGEVVIEVADVGVGMDGETLSCVFQPFFTTKPEGTGLGMVMARTITLALGGRMSVESILGEGTTVGVRLGRAD